MTENPVSKLRPAIDVECKPLVTIAIPTYCRVAYLKEALSSASAQTYPNIEIVVSDNASDDGTSHLLSTMSDPRIRFIRQETNIGMIGNWNACLRMARGEFFLLLSDDDTLLPTAVRDLVSVFVSANTHLIEKDALAFVYGYSMLLRKESGMRVKSRDAPSYEPSGKYRKEFLSCTRTHFPSSTLYRTDDILQIGGFSDRFGSATDIGLAFTVSQKYLFVGCTRTLTSTYLVHNASITSTNKLEAILNSSRSLTLLALQLADPSSPWGPMVIQKAGDTHFYLTLINVILENLASRTLSVSSFIKILWKFRKTLLSLNGILRIIERVPRLLSKIVMLRCSPRLIRTATK